MKRNLTLILLFALMHTFAQAQRSIELDFKGAWSTAQQELFRNMDLCKIYTFQLGEEGRGRLAINVTFESVETEDVPSNYQVFAPFKYTIHSSAEDREIYDLAVEFLEVRFSYEDNPLFLNLAMPPSYQHYFDFLKNKYERNNFIYQLIPQNDNVIRLESEHFEGLSKELELKQFGRRVSCEQLVRN